MRRTVIHNQEYWPSVIVLLGPDGSFAKERGIEPGGEDVAVDLRLCMVINITFLFRIVE
jgi:hypothetical protein